MRGGGGGRKRFMGYEPKLKAFGSDRERMLRRRVILSPCMEWPKAGCMCFMIAFHSRHTNLQLSTKGRSVTCCKIST